MEEPSLQPILIYQPGKVGSLSVYKSLKSALPGAELYHVHYLCNLDDIEQDIRRNYLNVEDSLKEIEKGKAIRLLIDKSSSDTLWTVVSMVRDPIARHVSAVFELLPQVIPGFSEAYRLGQITRAVIVKHIIELPEGMTSWYAQQLRPLFDIDIYENPFPRDKGYQIYEGQKARLLLIRLEDLNRVVSNAFREFLGISNFVLQSENAAENRPYGNLYERLRTLKLPDGYVNSFYSTEFAKHFYSETEINKLKDRWSLQS